MAASGVTSTISPVTGDSRPPPVRSPSRTPELDRMACRSRPRYHVPLGDHPRGTRVTPYLQLHARKACLTRRQAWHMASVRLAGRKVKDGGGNLFGVVLDVEIRVTDEPGG